MPRRAPTPKKSSRDLEREDKETAFYSGKVAAGKFFAVNVLTSVKGRCEGIKRADKTALEISEEAFAY